MLSRTSLLIKRCSHYQAPLMNNEILEILDPKDGKVYIDMTFGNGGHTRSLLNTNKSMKIIAVDRDPAAIKIAQELANHIELKSQRLGINQKLIPIHGKFSNVINRIYLQGIPQDTVDGILFDLGASSFQYEDPERGFNPSLNGPLDMRMDTTNSWDITAEDVINNSDQRKLEQIFRILGGERRYQKVANLILDARALMGRIKTTNELVRILQSHASHSKIFQALRIFVNNELNELNYALNKVRKYLVPKSGLAVVLTSNALEDRIVKRHFTGIDMNEPVIKRLSQHDRIRTSFSTSIENINTKLNEDKFWEPQTKHVLKPTEEETIINSKSQGTKLRAAVRLE